LTDVTEELTASIIRVNHLNPAHIITPYFFNTVTILILSSHLRQVLATCLFPSGFTSKIAYAFLISPMRATCPAHLILIDLIIQIRSGGELKLCSFWLWNILQPLVTVSLEDQNILLSILFSNTLSSWKWLSSGM
jgi:hypothetical protein